MTADGAAPLSVEDESIEPGILMVVERRETKKV